MGDELLVVTVTRAGGADDDGEHGPEVWLFYCDGETEMMTDCQCWIRDQGEIRGSGSEMKVNGKEMGQGGWERREDGIGNNEY